MPCHAKRVCGIMDLMLILFLVILGARGHSSSADDSGRKLEFLQILHRHGERTPAFVYPTDPYDKSYWPEGLGQLTQRGMRQCYELGQFLRTRYGEFLNTTYYNNQIYVLSCDKPRTIMSADAVLAGLYPPTGWQKWEIDMNWQPIPVHTLPKDVDYMLRFNAECPRYADEMLQVHTSVEFRHMRNQFSDVFDVLSENVGFKVHFPITAAQIYLSLYVESTRNWPLPDWTEQIFPEPLKSLNDFAYQALLWTTEMTRLQTGYLLNSITEYTRKYVNGRIRPSDLRYVQYSGHDTTIAGIMNLLGMFNNIQPPFASALMFEVYSDPVHGHVINVYYRNDTSVEPYPMTISGCDFDCPVDEFYTITAPLVTTEPEKDCEIRGTRTTTTTSASVTSIENSTSPYSTSDPSSSPSTPSSASFIYVSNSLLIAHIFTVCCHLLCYLYC